MICCVLRNIAQNSNLCNVCTVLPSFTLSLQAWIRPYDLDLWPRGRCGRLLELYRDLFEGRTTDGRTDRPTICRIYTILTNNTHKREKQQLQQLKMFYHVHVYHVYYVLSCYCACLIKHLMLQYSINHWIELKQKKKKARKSATSIKRWSPAINMVKQNVIMANVQTFSGLKSESVKALSKSAYNCENCP